MAFRYLLFHKPFNVLSQFTPGSTPPASGEPRRTLAEFIPVPGVYPVGRLDFDSEGLLLLTDDTKLQHQLGDPRFEHPRTYWVQVEGSVTDDAIERLSNGVQISGYRTKPATAKRLPEPDIGPRMPSIRVRRMIPTDWLELTLREGRNRQVRRMTAAVGCPTLRLIRVAIGPLRLDGLANGEWRDLSEREITALQVSRQSKQRN